MKTFARSVYRVSANETDWLKHLYYGSGHLISDFERDRLHREVLRTQGQISTRSEYDRSGRLRSRKRRHASQSPILPAAAQKHFETSRVTPT